ncbi:hypothetical protein BC833DRAFT_598193 [Globomyces pollinis-pini]|nr:hypothetical protein BC833DRAFT_598193 [Globomyces pollinis-pini]
MDERKQEELESLGFIFTEEELQIVSDNELIVSCLLDDPDLLTSLKFCPNSSHLFENEEDIHSCESIHLFNITLKFGEDYPDSLPEFTFETEVLYSEELDLLHENVTEYLNDSLGIGMVYTLVSYAKEQAEIIIRERLVREEAERSELADKREEEERKIYEGTRVNKDSFKEWQQAFINEAKMKQKRGEALSISLQAAIAVDIMKAASTKLTGRELFEKDLQLLKSDEQYMEDETEDVIVDNTQFGKMDINDEEENLVLANLTED